MRSSLLLGCSVALLWLQGCDGEADGPFEGAGDAAAAEAGSPGTDLGASADAAPFHDAAGFDTGSPDAASPDAGAADSALAPDAAPLPEGPWSVEAPGHYQVGFRVLETTYTPVAMEAPRTIRVAIWYPTRAEEGAPVRYLDLISADVLGDAPVGIDAPAPVVVFSHGSFGTAEQSFFFTEFFASHGWLVAAMDHPGNTFRDRDSALPAGMFELRPQDVSATLDLLESLPGDDPLVGLFSDAILLAGHSFGGYTTLAVAGAAFDVDTVTELACAPDGDPELCAYAREGRERFVEGFFDGRVRAAAPMTPAGATFFGPGLAEVAVPTLLITAARDATLPNDVEGDPIWEQLVGPEHRRIDFANAGHFSFTSFCEVLPGVGADDGCGATFLPPERVHRAVNAYTLAFARRHLLGDESGADLIDGNRAIEEDVTLSQH